MPVEILLKSLVMDVLTLIQVGVIIWVDVTVRVVQVLLTIRNTAFHSSPNALSPFALGWNLSKHTSKLAQFIFEFDSKGRWEKGKESSVLWALTRTN